MITFKEFIQLRESGTQGIGVVNASGARGMPVTGGAKGSGLSAQASQPSPFAVNRYGKSPGADQIKPSAFLPGTPPKGFKPAISKFLPGPQQPMAAVPGFINDKNKIQSAQQGQSANAKPS